MLTCSEISASHLVRETRLGAIRTSCKTQLLCLQVCTTTENLNTLYTHPHLSLNISPLVRWKKTKWEQVFLSWFQELCLNLNHRTHVTDPNYNCHGNVAVCMPNAGKRIWAVWSKIFFFFWRLINQMTKYLCDFELSCLWSSFPPSGRTLSPRWAPPRDCQPGGLWVDPWGFARWSLPPHSRAP